MELNASASDVQASKSTNETCSVNIRLPLNREAGLQVRPSDLVLKFLRPLRSYCATILQIALDFARQRSQKVNYNFNETLERAWGTVPLEQDRLVRYMPWRDQMEGQYRLQTTEIFKDPHIRTIRIDDNAYTV